MIDDSTSKRMKQVAVSLTPLGHFETILPRNGDDLSCVP